MKRKLLLSLPIMLAIAFAGCFGSDTKKVEADDWVDDLCDAAEDLSDAEVDAWEEYDALFQDLDYGDAEDLRDGLLDYLDAYHAALDDFEAELDKMGEPDVRDGKQVVEAVREFIAEEREELDDAEEDVEDLDEDGEDLFFAVDDIFGGLKYTDLLKLLTDSDARDADDIIDLIDEDEDCADYLFLD